MAFMQIPGACIDFVEDSDRDWEWKNERNGDAPEIILSKYIGEKKKVVVPFGYIVAKNLKQFVSLLQNGTLEDLLDIAEFHPAWDVCGYVNTIADSAFEDNDTIEEIWLPNTITKIGKNAFRSCTALKHVYFYDAQRRNAKIIYRCSEDDCLNAEIECCYAENRDVPESRLESLPEGLFEFCERLKSFDYLKDVSSIGASCFHGCGMLGRAELPDRLEKIPDMAFAGCKLLKDIHIPDTVKKIGKEAFSECKQLESIDIPSDIDCLQEGTFYYCISLERISLPCKIHSIGDACFRGCVALKDITLPACLKTIGQGAFACCRRVGRMVVPMSVEDIGGSAFSDCAGLSVIELPEVIGNIGAYAFKGCVNLTECILPYNQPYVADGLFQGCRSLENIRIQEGIRSVGINAFFGCKNLKELRIPESTRDIEKNAFAESGIENLFLPRRFDTKDLKECGINYEQTNVEWI